MKSMTVSLQNQKKALQLKYLIQLTNTQNKQQLTQVLNKIYPFTEYPLNSAPPLELFQTHEQKFISDNLYSQLSNHSYIIVTGGLVICKGQHEFVENRYLNLDSQEEIVFNIKDDGVVLKALTNTCYLKIHNIWINLAKKRQKADLEDFIKEKLLMVPFFANLSFDQFSKCCKAAYVSIHGPGDVLLKSGDTPYNMYIVAQGELVFERKIKFLKDKELWLDVVNQLQRQEDDSCQLMFNYLVKNPKINEESFEVIVRIKSINQNQIICAKETLCQQPLAYDILSSLKTKLICLKYPDFYVLNSDRLVEIRLWPTFNRDDIQLRKDYYYQLKWQDFKEQVRKQSKLNKLQKQKFQDFLRKAVNLSQDKHYYCPHKVGEGNVIDSPASKVSKLKSMTYTEKK